MRVLLTNARLEERAGSELYIADVARWLRDHGHQPMVYSARLGPFADAIRQESIPVVSDPRDLGEAPDVIHGQHHLATMSALATFPLVPAVGLCHGWIPWEEAPAHHPAVRRYVAVSSVTRERVVTEGGIPAGIVRVVPNFVDLDRFRPRAPLPDTPRRALVFSNSARAGGWLDAVLTACGERGIEVDVAGIGAGKPLTEPGAVLPDYDLVFARGRSALEAMAVGAAVVLCDVEGCGPFVTAAEFDRLRDGNFGQFVMRQPHAGPYLGEQIDRYDIAEAQAASEIVRTTLGRDHVVPMLMDVYQEAIAEVGARPHTFAEARTAETGYLRWLDRDYPRPVLDSFRAMDRRVHELGFERDEARARATRVEAEAATLRAEAEAVRAEAGAVRAEAGAVRAEAGAVRAEADAVRAEFDQLRSGFLVRVIVPRLWSLRERVAPTGSHRYRLYRAARGVRQLGAKPRFVAFPRGAWKRSAADFALSHGPYASSNLTLHAATARAYSLARQGTRRLRPMHVASRSLRIREAASLPPLAWTAVMTEDDCEVTVGPAVEVSDGGVFEGVWDGDFEAFQPHLTEFAFGSGVVRMPRDGRLRFVTPRHAMEFTYVVRQALARRTIVSNSLAFALTVAGVDTTSDLFEEIARRWYVRTIEQAKEGVDWARPLIATCDDVDVYQVGYHGFEIDGAGSPRLLWTPPRSHFSDFVSYRSFLLRVTGAVLRNGADAGRRRLLTPITTVSSGYDSVAASALVAALGCREAVTLDVEVYGRLDSGRIPGEALGLEVHSFPHVMGPEIAELDFEFGPALAEQASEFIATAGLGDDVTFLPFEPRLHDRVLFTGKGGDGTWDLEKPLRSGFQVPTARGFGRSYSEFRLRVGFAHVPIAKLGTRFAAPLNKLGQSQELARYRIGGGYDRPIARRLAEEAGVPRNAFGQMKTATSPLPLNRSELFPVAMATTMERYEGWRD